VTVYSVYEPTKGDADLALRAERLAFVKEGFSWPAFFVPYLWLIYHRMWIELILLIVLLVALQLAIGGGQGQALMGWASLAISVLFAVEANNLRSLALERRGHAFAGVASGSTREDAELSFLRAWLPQQARAERSPEAAPERPRQAPAPLLPRPRDEGEEVIGLFPKA
jgi:hypothetical protein